MTNQATAASRAAAEAELKKRQEHRKTDRSNRVIALPTFTAEALRRRMAVMRDHSPDAVVFSSREGTPLTTANVRRQLRKVLGDAGIEGVTPHMSAAPSPRLSTSRRASTWPPSCSGTPMRR
jgi:site-specific recombinase XerD